MTDKKLEDWSGRERRQSARVDAQVALQLSGAEEGFPVESLTTESINVGAEGVYCHVGHFIAPSGRRRRVRAFWFQDYNRSIVGVDETLTPVGPPEWKLRFTPSEVGEYRYRLEVRAAGENPTRRLGRAYDAWSRSATRRWARLARAVWRPTTLQAAQPQVVSVQK